MAYRDYSIANGWIVDVDGFGDFTTLAAALAVAPAGQIIFLKTSVTENVTIPADVSVVGIAASQFNDDIVSIIGKVTMTAAGSSTIANIRLVTNSDYCISVTGSNLCNLSFFSCVIEALNNTAINFTNSNSLSNITFDQCIVEINATGIALYSSSSAGNITFSYVRCENTGLSTTAATNSAGGANWQYSIISFPIAASGGAINLQNCIFGPSVASTTNVQLTGTCTLNDFFSSHYSGAQPTFGIGSTCIANMVGVTISSSNATPIQGSGTLNKAYLAFTGSGSAIAGTLTVTTYTTA